jgi:hypothetical protein
MRRIACLWRSACRGPRISRGARDKLGRGLVGVVGFLAMVFSAMESGADVARNLGRYWQYRDRLRKEFLVQGEGQGLSLPADTKWEYKKVLVGGQPKAKYQIGWADCTSHHGWYLATLATEHYLLSHPERFPGFRMGRAGAREAVEQELYFALRALRRLDETAEPSFRPGFPNTPGFFIRDDVTSAKVLRGPQGQPTDILSLFPGRPYDWLTSDYLARDPRDKEMSQDQVIHLLFGLSFVRRLVPASLEVRGLALRAEAQRLAASMVEMMTTKRPRCAAGERCGPWVIANPVLRKPVKRGADAGRMAPGIHKAIRFITDGKVSPCDHLPCGWARWYNFREFLYLHVPYNLAMTLALAAISNGWDRDGKRETFEALMEYAENDDWYLYPLANAVLQPEVVSSLARWGSHRKTLLSKVRPMLDTAPPEGPHTPRVGSAHPGWASPTRFSRTREEQNLGIEHHRGQARWYNGLDFMLLHNLLYLAIPEAWHSPR